MSDCLAKNCQMKREVYDDFGFPLGNIRCCDWCEWWHYERKVMEAKGEIKK